MENKNPQQQQIYWERQGQNRLCGLNCVNSLLQGGYFNEMDMTATALQLDEDEAQMLSDHQRPSENLADDGNYSIQVIQKTLAIHHMQIESIDSQLNKETDMTQENAFICNSDSHWFCIRKVFNTWFNLNSTNALSPQIISDFYLSAFLLSIREKGYSIFVVKGSFTSFDQNTHHPLNSNQLLFTLKDLQQIQSECLKNKSYKLNILGSDQAAMEQAIQNSLKEQEEQVKPQEDKEKTAVFFQGESVSLGQGMTKNEDLDEKFQILFYDQETLAMMQISMEERFSKTQEKREDQDIHISIRMPSGKSLEGYFSSNTSSINDLYDYVIYCFRASLQGQQLRPFKLLINYPKQDLTNIYSTLKDNNITANARLIMVFI